MSSTSTLVGGMVWITGGRTEIGSPEHHLAAIGAEQHYPRAWFDDEGPQHLEVTAGFWLDRTPVTNSQFGEFAADTGWITATERRKEGLVYGPAYWDTLPGVSWRRPSHDIDAVADRPDHPVVHVDHADASAYARWAGKRLPTEIEWEHAAHGPTWRAWPWGSTWSADAANSAEFWAGAELRALADWKAWYTSHWRANGAAPATTPVGQFRDFASPCGILDMAGQVTEWTATVYHPYAAASTDPSYAAAGRLGFMVARGGSWKMMRWQTRTSERICGIPEYAAFDLGFRCAADAPPPTDSTEDSHNKEHHG
ncbi:SUMF1/EgtB/PvdO family nonheme iron enzyme [Nocardia sp. XZ_19_231]|uniref:formylglycine-generating enzyme family protein n=1 Tax=Nocardia sp. XZ_19_231 TaxID=2769252 RepID=UPI00188E92CF|nr:SUMF1/EgtB/PvdO family nonheme iron enzyme [Nocardia sp. XZ_19_231]